MANLTESQAVEKAKELLQNVTGENWTYSIMKENESNKFIWSYLYNNELQYIVPIIYGNNNMVILCHQK